MREGAEERVFLNKLINNKLREVKQVTSGGPFGKTPSS